MCQLIGLQTPEVLCSDPSSVAVVKGFQLTPAGAFTLPMSVFDTLSKLDPDSLLVESMKEEQDERSADSDDDTSDPEESESAVEKFTEPE